MLELVKGHQIPHPELVSEGYAQMSGVSLSANVNASKLYGLFEDFVTRNDEPKFFILELPVIKDREEEIEPGVIAAHHKDVYYMDGCSTKECLTILETAGEVLINDGINLFGFGYHHSNDEILLDKYNVVTVYSESIDTYKTLFEKHGIHEQTPLVTAWDTFTEDEPGMSGLYESDGKTVYDIPKAFKDWGMYLAETREG